MGVFPKISSTFLGVPITIVYWGVYIGFPPFWETTILSFGNKGQHVEKRMEHDMGTGI